MFEKFLEENKELLEKLMKDDQYQLIFECWFAGYESGMKNMATIAANVYGVKKDV